MNLKKLKQAEANFLTRYPDGFADPAMAPIKKKHNVDKLTEFAQANLTRTHFNRPEHICDTLVRIISRSSMVSMFEKQSLPKTPSTDSSPLYIIEKQPVNGDRFFLEKYRSSMVT